MTARLASAAVLAAGLLVLAGCSGPAAGGAGAGAAGGRSAGGHSAGGSSAGGHSAAGGPALATSLADAGGTNWAVVQMGGRAAQEENFWQLLVRPAGSGSWRLATPDGVADNGGLVVASTGAGALLAGFRPSQDLTFSPLAATTDAGTRWSGSGPLSPGLSDVPGALAAGPGGRLLALTDGGGVRLSTDLGARWSLLTTAVRLAATPAGRACGLTAVTAAAFTADGVPLLGGTCTRAGVAGVFALRDGTWEPAGPTLAGAVGAIGASQAGRAGGGGGGGGAASRVLALSSRAGGMVCLLAVSGRGGAGVIAAWSAGQRWALSPVRRTGAAVRSAELWTGGSAGLVLAGGRAVTIAGPGAAWTALPPLPAGTSTLAQGPGGRAEALAPEGSRLVIWLGSAARASTTAVSSAGWSQEQVIRVPIPYGSSG